MQRLALVLSVASLLLTPFATQAYERERHPSNEDVCLYLPTRSFTYAISEPGSARTTGTSEDNAIAAAFATWSEAIGSCSDMQFTQSARTQTRRAEYLPQGANENVVIFREQLCSDVVDAEDSCWLDYDCNNVHDCWHHNANDIAQPLITYDSKGKIVDVDFELNAARFEFTTVDSPACSGTPDQSCVAIDVQSAMTFLVGRALGLLQTETISQGQLKRTVSDDSRDGVCAIYPAGAPTTQCDGTPIVDPTPQDAGTEPDAGSTDPDAGTSEPVVPGTPQPEPQKPEEPKAHGCGSVGGKPMLIVAAVVIVVFLLRSRRTNRG